MERHVKLLGILANLWGLLATLVGVSMLLLAAGALTELLAPIDNASGFIELIVGVFALLGAFALVWGGAHVWAAVLLRRHRPWGRILVLGLAVSNLLLLPFGTAFGVYSLWVLLKNDGRRLFEPTTT